MNLPHAVNILVLVGLLQQSANAQTFTDDFNDGDGNGWITRPNGNIVSSAFQSSPYEFALFLLPGESVGDFTFEADATILTRYNDSGGADHISLVLNVPFDPVSGTLLSNNFYMFTTRQGTLNDSYFYNAANGQFLASTGYSLNPIMGTHHFKVSKTGRTYECFIDGSLLLTWTGGSSQYDGGYIGISGSQGFTGTGTVPTISWDNVTLTVGATTFTDDFNDGDGNGWITRPNGNISNFTFQSSPYELALFLLPGEIVGDFTFEADATILTRYNDSGGADHISLVLNVPFDPISGTLLSDNFYMFTTRQGTLNDSYFYNAANGQFLASTGYSLNPIMGTHHFKVSKTDHTYECFIDGSLLLTWTGGSSQYDGGYIGISGSQGFTGTGTVPTISWDNVQVTKVPTDLPPVTVVASVSPTSGDGSFDYTINLTNNSDSSQTVDIWSVVFDPHGDRRRDVQVVYGKTLSPGRSYSKTTEKQLGENTPFGEYTFVAYVGTYPDDIIDSSSAVYTKVTDDHAVEWYHFDELSGSFVADASVNGHHGTATGTEIVDGFLGKAREYQVWTDEVLVPIPFNGVQDNFTIEAWINVNVLNSNTANASNTIFRNRQHVYDVFLVLANDGRVHTNIHNNTLSNELYSSAVIPLHEWHHVAFTYDSQTMRIYIDGVLDTADSIGALNHDWTLNYIGTSIGSNTFDGSDWAFNGIIDELRVSDIALTGDQLMSSIRGVSTSKPAGREPSEPLGFRLDEAYPNPFNPSTTIRYALDEDGHVTLKVCNMLGQLVTTIVDETQTAGLKSVVWNGKNDSGAGVASGVYIYRITAGTFTATRRMLLLR